MWIRTGFWAGKPRPGSEAALRTIVSEEVLPGIRAFPMVRRANLLWPMEFQDRPADLFCQIVIEYGDEAAMREMQAHRDFPGLKAAVAKAFDLLDGAISHINYQSG